MKIEPCLYCGAEMEDCDGFCLCRKCTQTLDYNEVEQHNRLSRIVRAAEKWARARRFGTMLEISETGKELLLAVEGGAE